MTKGKKKFHNTVILQLKRTIGYRIVNDTPLLFCNRPTLLFETHSAAL